jgi:hypothetical protein
MKTIIFLAISFTAFSANAQGFFGFKPGGANSTVSGSATEGSSTNSAPSLEKCESFLGTIAVVEPQDAVSQALQMYKLPAPTQLLRLMIQQSKCFQVVERGMAMQNIQQERALSSSGLLQGGQNMGGSQMVAADFLLTANVQFSESNASGAGVAASIGSFFGPVGTLVGAVAGGIKEKQASTSIIISDARSGIQVAAAEGNVSKTDWGAGGVLGGVGIGAYANTAEGKIVAAALLDNYNNVVKAVRELPVLANSRTPEASKTNAQLSAPKLEVGSIFKPKIAGIQLYSQSKKSSKIVARIGKDSEMVFTGEDENGFIKVQSVEGEGWVEKIMVRN